MNALIYVPWDTPSDPAHPTTALWGPAWFPGSGCTVSASGTRFYPNVILTLALILTPTLTLTLDTDTGMGLGLELG